MQEWSRSIDVHVGEPDRNAKEIYVCEAEACRAERETLEVTVGGIGPHTGGCHICGEVTNVIWLAIFVHIQLFLAKLQPTTSHTT
jgi:hypothetical protein